MRWTIALFVCFVQLIVLASSVRTRNKEVEATCRRNFRDGSLRMEFFLEFNGDPVTAFHALEGTSYVYNNDGSDNTAFCQFQGSFSTSIFVRSVVYTDGQADVNPCGVRRIQVAGTTTGYIWYFAPREYATRQVFTDIDATYSVTCTLEDAVNNEVVTLARVIDYDDEHVPTRVEPENQMAILGRESGSLQFVQPADSTVMREQEVKLLVRTKAKAPAFRNEDLDYYGSYIFSCDTRRTLDGDRTVFIGTNGCPNSVYDMIGGFRYARIAPISGNQFVWYESESSSFILAPRGSRPTQYYISCYVEYCYGVQFSDPNCDDYCGSNTRKRRSVNGTVMSEKINLIVNIVDDDNDDNANQAVTSESSVGDNSTMLLAIISGISVVILAGIIVVVLIVCQRRRRDRDNSDTSSTTDSNVNLPHHVVFPAKNPNF